MIDLIFYTITWNITLKITILHQISKIKRLRMYMQASMTENRLTGLALMHIHYAKTVDLNKVIEEFVNKHPQENEAAMHHIWLLVLMIISYNFLPSNNVLVESEH